MNVGSWLGRRVRRVRRNIGRNQERSRSARGRVGTVLVCVLAGLMMTVAAIAARGTDLRADRNSDIRSLIVAQGQRNSELKGEADRIGKDIKELSGQVGGASGTSEQLDRAQLEAGLTAVSGPGLRVTLSDAPGDVKPAGVDDDSLVVHQQDIQAVVNALWSGGAEAISIQGQRIISTTGIKCVGNTVVLHGVPYAPPYVIEAIGGAADLRAGLGSSKAVTIYKQYVEAYGLGYSVEDVGRLDLPAFSGSTGITNAEKED